MTIPRSLQMVPLALLISQFPLCTLLIMSIRRRIAHRRLLVARVDWMLAAK